MMKCNDEWHVFVDGDAKCQCGAGERKIIDAQPPVSSPGARLFELIEEWRALANHIDNRSGDDAAANVYRLRKCADELAGVLRAAGDKA